jgi:hypothetical protein
MSAHDSSIVANMSSSTVRSLLSLAKGDQSPTAIFDLVALFTLDPEESSRAELRVLLDDLERPILSPNPGPLSFQRLSGIDRRELQGLEAKSLLRVLTSDSTAKQILERLADYGNILGLPQMPQATRRAGIVIASLAMAVLVHRFHKVLPPEQYSAVEHVLRSMSQAEALPRSLRDYSARAVKDIRLGAQSDG